MDHVTYNTPVTVDVDSIFQPASSCLDYSTTQDAVYLLTGSRKPGWLLSMSGLWLEVVLVPLQLLTSTRYGILTL